MLDLLLFISLLIRTNVITSLFKNQKLNINWQKNII